MAIGFIPATTAHQLIVLSYMYAYFFLLFIVVNDYIIIP